VGEGGGTPQGALRAELPVDVRVIPSFHRANPHENPMIAPPDAPMQALKSYPCLTYGIPLREPYKHP